MFFQWKFLKSILNNSQVKEEIQTKIAEFLKQNVNKTLHISL